MGMFYKKVCVMLDNGHGVDTKGKRSPDGRLLEYKYAREIVSLLKEELEKCEIEVFVVTPEEKDISLQTRVNRINNKYAEMNKKGYKSLLISVHCNAAGNGSSWLNARGWSSYTSSGQTNGDKLASCLYEEAHKVLDKKKIKIREDWSDGDADIEANLYICRKSNCPATLTENFFQDNKDDVNYLLSEEGKKDIVNIHFEGILNYIEKYC